MSTGREVAVPPEIAREIEEHALFFRISGAAALITGILAIVMPHVATFAAGITIGALFLANGIIGAVTALRARGSGSKRVLAGFLIGMLGAVAGGVLLLQPFAGVVALTLFLAAYLVAGGLLRGWFAWNLRPAAGWRMVAGAAALSVVLGLLITTGLPGNARWVLGLIVGVDLVFSGIALLGIVGAVRRAQPPGDDAFADRDAPAGSAWQQG